MSEKSVFSMLLTGASLAFLAAKVALSKGRTGDQPTPATLKKPAKRQMMRRDGI